MEKRRHCDTCFLLAMENARCDVHRSGDAPSHVVAGKATRMVETPVRKERDFVAIYRVVISEA